ncbi:hypothetical protein [Streptomyces sp. NPDC001401]|uniref:hypothetical protein n=1 Tax=Streptomyces sp. NPDC001401 TaxID=3364570 RepID=UPI00369A23B2
MAVSAVGIWVAGRTWKGFRIHGSAPMQLLTVAVAVLLSQAVPHRMVQPISEAWRHRQEARTEQEMAEFTRRMDEIRADATGKSDEQLNRAYEWAGGLRVSLGCHMALLLLVLEVLLFWLGLGICTAVGLPLRIAGIGSVLLAYATTYAVVGLSVAPPHLRVAPGRLMGGSRYRVAGYLVCLGILTLSAAFVDGVGLASGPGWRQALTLAVLAALFHLPDYTYAFPSRSRDLGVRLVFNAVKLLLIGWLGTYTALPFHIRSVLGFLLLALLLTAALWPLQRAWAQSVRTALRGS